MSTFGFKNWISVFWILGFALSPSRAENNEVAENLETCKTDDCARISRLLTNTIDSDVRPCHDFYAYACGKALKETKIPPGWDAVDTPNTVVALMIGTLLKSMKQTKSNDPEVVKKAKSFFASCNSEAEIANLGVVPLTILMKSLNLPLRPPYLGALDMKDGFGTLIGKMRQYLRDNFPFQLRVKIDPADRNKSRLELLVPQKDKNSNFPYKPSTTPTPQPQAQIKPEEIKPKETKPKQNKPNNKSKTPVKKRKKEEEETTAAARNQGQNVSENRSFSMVTRALRDSSRSSMTSKANKRTANTSSQDKKGDEETKKPKSDTPKKTTKKPVPKKDDEENPAGKKPAKEKTEDKDKKEPKKGEMKTGEESTEKSEAPKKKTTVPKSTQKKKPQKSENEQKKAKSNESSAKLEITEDENQPLIEYMIKVAKYLYKQTNVKLLESKNDSLRQKVAEVAKIIHQVEKLTVKAREEPGENGKEMTIQELQELTNSFDTKTEKKPVIDWTNLISATLGHHPTILKQFLEEGRKIYVANVNYLESILKLFYESNPRAIYCALWWFVVRSVILELPAELRAFESDYRKQAKIYDPPREEYCLISTINAYSYAAAYDIVTDEKTTNNVKTASDMWGYFNGPFVWMLQNSSIMDSRTIMAANVRYDNGYHIFGVPSGFENAKGLNEAFRGVIFHESNYFFSLFFEAYETIRKEMGLLDSASSFGLYNPLATKPDYNLQYNMQVVPLAYSQFPFMSNGLTSITMGMLVLPFFQQAFHHYDVLASEYNLWGIKENWWAKKSLRNYYAQAECFINAYSKECFDGVGCVDGKRTLHENVADHGALKAAIQGYKNIQRQIKEPRLIDFESFTHLRLLTLSFAVSMCEVQTPRKLSETLKTSKYAPASVRVNQVMKNLPEFSEIWGCEADDAMNPKEKCEMWGFIEESKRKFVKTD